MPRDTIRSRCDELLSVLDLQDEEKKLTLEYSHGMKKKLAMAAALLPNPDLLFLDEPFEGVDAVTSRVIRDLLAGFVARGLDGLSDFARPGDRRAAVHARRASSSRGSWSNRPRSKRSGKGARWRIAFLQKAGADHDGTPKLNWLEEAAS